MHSKNAHDIIPSTSQAQHTTSFMRQTTSNRPPAPSPCPNPPRSPAFTRKLCDCRGHRRYSALVDTQFLQGCYPSPSDSAVSFPCHDVCVATTFNPLAKRVKTTGAEEVCTLLLPLPRTYCTQFVCPRTQVLRAKRGRTSFLRSLHKTLHDNIPSSLPQFPSVVNDGKEVNAMRYSSPAAVFARRETAACFR